MLNVIFGENMQNKNIEITERFEPINLLDPSIAYGVLDEARKLGANFADIFIEHHTRNVIDILSGKVHEVDGGIDFGIGIRLVYGIQVLYGYTNHKDIDELIRITRALSTLNKRAPQLDSLPSFNFESPKNIHSTKWTLDKTMGEESDIAKEKVDYLMSISNFMLNHDSRIIQAKASVLERLQKVQIFNTEGLHTSDQRQYCRLLVNAIASDGKERSDGYEAPGSFTGWEMSENYRPEELAAEVTKQALVKLTADDCPAGKMPVVIDNGFGGVIFHEACGHLLETTSVAKKASVFHDKMGEMIASECVSAIDDGTMSNTWGSINIDDEGTPTQKTDLIVNGKLNSFLVDKVGAMKTGYTPTGSGRRESYKFAPASRMRNTFIASGKDKLEDMIASIDHGIYCKKMGGGSVTPGTGEFNFSAQESYLIKNGKVDRPLKSATLIGSGPEVLTKISMVGDNLDLAAGMCGSVSGAVPTTVGQPAIKVDNILVGGQSS